MTGEMGVLTAYEVSKLMKKLSRERTRVLKAFVEKAYALGVGEEMYQPFLSSLPSVPELRILLNDESSELRFNIWQTINGIMVKREA